MKGEVRLKLYVLSDGQGYQEKLDAIGRLLDKSSGQRCTTAVIDLSRHPEQAEEQQILAIPTLIKEEPVPPLRLIGDIDDVEQVARLLSTSR